MIIAGASPGETKMWAAVRENGDFLALAVRITRLDLRRSAAARCQQSRLASVCAPNVSLQKNFEDHSGEKTLSRYDCLNK